MTKVLYLYENLKVGGAEQLLLTTIKYLNRDKFMPIIYCIGEKGEIGCEIEQETGFSVNALNKKSWRLWSIAIFLDLLRILRKERPHILHTHLFYANYFGRIAAIFARIPIVVVTEHGTYSNFKRFYHHWIDFLLSLFTTKIIAVSSAVKKYLLRHSLISARKIVVIHNAVDFDRFNRVYEDDKLTIRKRLGFSNNNLIIGCVSNLAPWKGQFFLLQAFTEVIRSHPSAKLCFVGRDTNGFMDELQAFAKKNNFQENVSFFGERRDIPQILKSFDIFVLPSFTEGLGISLLEAMYMGLATIASKTEGVLEIIEDNKDGILASCGDYQVLANKINLLLNDRGKMESLGCNARQKVSKHFPPDAFANRLGSFYEELIQI